MLLLCRNGMTKYYYMGSFWMIFIMKKIYGLLAYLLLFVFIGGCAGTADTLSLQDFWNEEETADNDTMKFVTGLEIIFPKECSCTVRT